MDSLERELEKIRKKEAEILAKIDKRNKKRKIKCAACGSSHQIQELTLIQTHWYVAPTGCIGGDFWKEGEMQFVCPDTQIRNRLFFYGGVSPENPENTVEEQFKSKYGHLFKEVIEEYEKHPTRYRVNNDFYTNRKNCERFGLIDKKER